MPVSCVTVAVAVDVFQSGKKSGGRIGGTAFSWGFL